MGPFLYHTIEMPPKLTLPSADVVRPYDRELPRLIAKQSKFYWLQNGNVRLRIMLADAPVDDPRGTLIFCPGRTEFIEKYFETVEDFLKRGFTILVVDPRGQGLSDRLLDDRTKSYVKRFQDYADDLSFATAQLSSHLPKPHILMGHSMGGCIALQAVISGVMNPTAIICSAPMLGLFDVETSVLSNVIKIAAMLGFSKRNLPFQGQKNGLPAEFSGNKLTSDKARFERWAEYFQSTPDLRVGPPTIAWIAEALRGMAFVNRNADKVKIPGLIIAAGGDPIVDPASNHRFCQSSGLDYKVVPGALHELFMERDQFRNQFLNEFDAFLERNAL